MQVLDAFGQDIPYLVLRITHILLLAAKTSYAEPEIVFSAVLDNNRFIAMVIQ